MYMPQEQTPKLPIKRHLVIVRKAPVGDIPLEGNGAHHFQHLHDDHLHEVDGEDCYAAPPEMLARHCKLHRGNFAALTAILDVAANRGLHHNMAAIKGGSIDPGQIFIQAIHEEKDPVTKDVILREPAQSFVKTAEGKTILPLPIHDVADLLGKHHGHAQRGVDVSVPSRGGQASLDAIAALESLLKEIGLAPNHAGIKRGFCLNCMGHVDAAV